MELPIELKKLYTPTAPWIYLLVTSSNDAQRLAWELDQHHHFLNLNTPKNTSICSFIRLARGEKMKTHDSLMDELAAALQFPVYFKGGWNLFWTLMRDFTWAYHNTYIIFITDFDQVLIEDTQEEFSTLTYFLEGAGNWWSYPEEISTDIMCRPSCAFHTILQCTEENVDMVRLKLKNAGTTFLELPFKYIYPTSDIDEA